MGTSMSEVFTTLKVLTEQADEVEAIIDAYSHSDDNWGDDEYTVFGFSDVNMGVLDFLGELTNAGIAYDSTWDAGSNFGEGTEHCRFTPTGEVTTQTLYAADSSIPLGDLVEYLENHEMLKELILKKQAERHVEPLDAKQIEYGKLYQVARLVIPEKELRKTS